MKKNLYVFVFAAIMFASIVQINAQSVSYKGIYIDSFDAIVGNTLKEDSLLHYLKDSSFNSIICYRMSSVISSTLSSTKNTNLASFIKKARTQYGIKNVLASSESYDTFKTLVAPYNRSRTDSLERFNYYYLEFEFWNTNSTSPVSSTHNGYYCTTYLSPNGYACDTSGAFKYYRKMLTSLDSLAAKDALRSATYVGNPNQGQCKYIANTVDLLLCDNYTSSVSNIYTDVKTLFSYFGSTSKTLTIVPIFASYSPGGTFLGDWLTKTPVGPHSEKSAYYTYFLPRYTAETGSWKSKLNLVGYQWYRYSGMPHSGNYSTSTFCNPPTNLSSSSITSSSAIVSWTGISSGLGYVVQYRVVGSTTWSNPLAASGTSITLSGLSAASNYEFQVKSSCISSSSTYTTSAYFSTLSATSCAVPVGLNASSISDVAANLNWTTVIGASSYVLQYRKVGVTTWTSATSTSASKSISNLSASSIYEFQVKTTCSSGSSAFSTSYLFSTLAPICNAPSGLSASLITNNSATLKWTAISGVTGYTIQYRVVGATTWLLTTSATNSKSILALSENSKYEFQVQTNCSSTNASNFSVSALFTTLASCGMPTNVTASAATTTSFTINWSANSLASSYTVHYRKTGNSTWTSVTTTNNYKNIASLSTGTTYEYQVAMVCASGTSSYSAINSVTTLSNTSSCGVPSGLFANNIALTSVTLNWLPVAGANSYTVQYRKTGSSTWTSKTTSFTNKNITSLLSNVQYEFQVQTVCSSGNSGFSLLSTFVTTPNLTVARMAPDSIGFDPLSSEKLNESINEISSPETFTIFPNPTDKDNINLRIQRQHKETIKVQVFDMLGKCVYSENVNTDDKGLAEIRINIQADLKVGIYQVIGNSATQKMNFKFILN